MENYKFILIEVIEREISEPEFHPTLEGAQKAMMDKFVPAMGLDDEDLAAAEPIEDVEGGFCVGSDYDCCFGKYAAYGERHGQNFDWRIFEL